MRPAVPRRLWPAHEWDGWQTPKPVADLYVGAAGVVWALDRLRERGYAETSARPRCRHASRARGLAREAGGADRTAQAGADAARAVHGRERHPARPLADRPDARDRRRPARTRPRQPHEPGQRRHVGDAWDAPRGAADARVDGRGPLGRRRPPDEGSRARRQGRRRAVGERPPRRELPRARAVPRRDRQRARARARGPRRGAARARRRRRTGSSTGRRRSATRTSCSSGAREAPGSSPAQPPTSTRTCCSAPRSSPGRQALPATRKARRSATARPAPVGPSSRRSSGRRTSSGWSGLGASPSTRSSRPAACPAATRSGPATSASPSSPPTASRRARRYPGARNLGVTAPVCRFPVRVALIGTGISCRPGGGRTAAKALMRSSCPRFQRISAGRDLSTKWPFTNAAPHAWPLGTATGRTQEDRGKEVGSRGRLPPASPSSERRLSNGRRACVSASRAAGGRIAGPDATGRNPGGRVPVRARPGRRADVEPLRRRWEPLRRLLLGLLRRLAASAGALRRLPPGKRRRST